MTDLILVGIQTVIDIQNLSAGITENRITTLFNQCFYEDICTGKKHSPHSFLRLSIIG